MGPPASESSALRTTLNRGPSPRSILAGHATPISSDRPTHGTGQAPDGNLCRREFFLSTRHHVGDGYLMVGDAFAFIDQSSPAGSTWPSIAAPGEPKSSTPISGSRLNMPRTLRNSSAWSAGASKPFPGLSIDSTSRHFSPCLFQPGGLQRWNGRYCPCWRGCVRSITNAHPSFLL